mgnify:CR=1 FL=1
MSAKAFLRLFEWVDPVWFKADCRAQMEWIAQKAAEAGFASAQEMMLKDEHKLRDLTIEWRRAHPMPEQPEPPRDQVF